MTAIDIALYSTYALVFILVRLAKYSASILTNRSIGFAGHLSTLLPPTGQIPWAISSKMHSLVWSIPIIHGEHPSGRPEVS
jgi:hypothetical protein